MIASNSSSLEFSQRGEKPAMRKYKTLALTIIAVVSFILFVIYKHEYDKLHYTLESLEVFGQPPQPGIGGQSQCRLAFVQRASTPPAEWTRVSSDISVYSSFWDEDNGLIQPKLRSVALAEKSSHLDELLFKVHYETGDVLKLSCEMESADDRKHVPGTSETLHIIFITCTPIASSVKTFLLSTSPHSVQFGVGGDHLTNLMPVHESSGFKTVEDKSALCILPTETGIRSINIVEFISYYQILGFGKFVFYGNNLTPQVRKLLDRYIDEMNIVVEEKSFNLESSMQSLNAKNSSASKSQMEYLVKRTIELDCQYRHRDTHQNILVIRSNEFLVPSTSDTIPPLLASLSRIGRIVKQVAEFHLSTQPVCIDKEHQLPSASNSLVLSQQLHSAGALSEEGVAILRPHLLTTSLGMMEQSGVMREQHVPAASAVVYRVLTCERQGAHEDVLHLPTRKNFIKMVEISLLYRKWKVSPTR